MLRDFGTQVVDSVRSVIASMERKENMAHEDCVYCNEVEKDTIPHNGHKIGGYEGGR